jgi:arylsulfatase A-like enzyme
MMLSVDESLGEIVKTLQNMDLLDNTLIIFTSDNGYFYGEHGLTIERRYPYEEAIKVPLIIRKPKTENAQTSSTIADTLVASIDLAPTILEYANIDIPVSMQGQSLHSVLEGGDKPAREAVFIEHFAHENPFIWTANIDYKALISQQYKLIKWNRYDNEYEMYNLEEDPGEINNLADEDVYKNRLTELLDQLRTETLNALGLPSGS